MRAWSLIRTSRSMRTSRVSKETSRHFKRETDASAAAPAPRRSTRTSLARFAFNADGSATAAAAAAVRDEEEVRSETRENDEGDDSSELSELEFGSDIEDAIKRSSSASPIRHQEQFNGESSTAAAATRKRKRPAKTTATTSRSNRMKAERNESSDSEVDMKNIPAASSSSSRRVRKPARTIRSPAGGGMKVEPPSDWEEIYALVKEMRLSGPAKNAAVDTMGCERLAGDNDTPRDRRFHTLVALMLSSQTKDTVNAEAMRRLRKEMPACEPGKPKGLNLENMLAVEPGLLNEMIGKVGFHNNKTKYLKQTAVILRDKFDSDIPPTIEGLTSLPGVGPKMAHLCMSAEAGWNRVEGIGVDVHVHRITNLWGWQSPPSKTPEETRMALQSWLPKDKWKEINWLLVGFGQSVCLPIGRKCGDCELGLRGLCKSAERKKVTEGRKRRELVKVEKLERGEEGDETVVKMEVERGVEQVVVKAEVVNEDVPESVRQEQVDLGPVKEEQEASFPPAEPAPEVNQEDPGTDVVMESIETDVIKQEVIKRESTMPRADTSDLPTSQLPTVKQESVKQEIRESGCLASQAVKQETVEQEPIIRRVPKRESAMKTELKQEDTEMPDAQEASIQQGEPLRQQGAVKREEATGQPPPIKQEATSQQPPARQRPRTSVVKPEELKQEETHTPAAVLAEEARTIKQESAVLQESPSRGNNSRLVVNTEVKHEDDEKVDVDVGNLQPVKKEEDGVVEGRYWQ